MFNNLRKILMVVGLALLVIGGIIVWRITHPPLTDQEQIVAHLEDIRTSVENRNTNGALGYLAKEFTFQGWSQKEMRFGLVDAFRKWRDVSLNISGVSVVVQGNTATSKGNYTLAYRSSMGGGTQRQAGNFQLTWEKRDGKWVITQAEGPSDLPE